MFLNLQFLFFETRITTDYFQSIFYLTICFPPMSSLTISTLILFKLLQVIHLKLINSPYLFFENEYIQTLNPVISIPLDFDISNQSQTSSLVQENNLTEEFKYTITPKAKLFSLIKPKQYIDIVQLEDQKLTFLYQIKNYQSNNQLLIHPSNYSIPLTQQNCFSLYYLQEESYLLTCKMQEHKIVIQILNLNQQTSKQDFKIKTLTDLDYNPLCELESNFIQSLLVIFEKNCSNSKLITYFIDVTHQEIINQTKFIMDEYNKSNELIIKIDICSLTILKIQTNNEILKLNLESSDFSPFLYMDQYYYQKSFQCTYLSILEARNTQLEFNQLSLNVSSVGFIKGFRLGQIFILQKKDHVIVYFSDILQIIIRKSFQQLFSLSNLPYMLGVTESGELLAYRIKIPRFSFTHSNSSKIQILEYQKLSNFSKQNIDYQILDEQILSESSPKFLIYNTTKFFKISEGSTYKFFLNEIQKSLPLQVKQLYINGKLINFKEVTKYLSCNIDLHNLKQISLISLEDDSFLILYILNDATKIIVARCANEKLQSIKKIKISKGFIQILNFNNPRFCVVQQNSFSVYQFENLELLESSYLFNSNIVNAIILNYTNLLCLRFEDCNQKCYYVEGYKFQLIFKIQSSQLECNDNKQQVSELFFIGEHEIFFKNKVSYQEQIILKDEIIKAELMLQHHKILLFTKYQQKIKIKLFSFRNNELQFLYDCPLYNFSVKIPFNYRLQDSFLLVLAENSKHSSILLVYRLDNQAINSLIQVIELDQEHLHFDFIFGNHKAIYYYYQNAIQIKELEVSTFYLENQIIYTSAVKVVNCSFTLETTIFNEIINFNVTEKYINDDYNLRLIQNDTLRLNSKNILDMSNIFSNIISIEVVSQNYQILRPLGFTDEKMTCEFYQNKCCFNQNTLVCWQDNQSLVYNFDLLYYYILTIDFNDDLSECIIISIKNQKYQMIIVSFQDYFSSVKPQIHSQEILKDLVIHMQIDLEIISQDRDLVVLQPEKTSQIFVFSKFYPDQQLSFNYSNQHNTLLYGTRFKDVYYIFLYQSGNAVFYSIVIISTNKTNEQQKIFYKIQLQDQICISNNYIEEVFKEIHNILPINFQKIQIIEFTLVNDILVIELLMLFELQIGFVTQLRIDIIKYGKCQIDVLQTLRYPNNSKLSRLLYVNKDYIIMSIITINKISFILYDRFQGQNVSLIHSIDVFPENNYIKIEKFNNSHLALTSIPNLDQQVQLITLSQYKLECLNKCNSTATLILKNEVSNLTITVQNINTEILPQYNIRLIIIIIDLLSISLFLQFRKKNNKNDVR